MMVHNILLVIMIIVALSGIRTIFWGARLSFHIMKNYPEKRRKYLTSFRAYKLLDKEQDTGDKEFMRLRKKFKNSRNITAGTMLVAIAFVLLLVLIAFILGR